MIQPISKLAVEFVNNRVLWWSSDDGDSIMFDDEVLMIVQDINTLCIPDINDVLHEAIIRCNVSCGVDIKDIYRDFGEIQEVISDKDK